jgi:hypothetical protein
MPPQHDTDADSAPCRPFFLALTIVAIAAVAQRYGLSNRTLVLTLTAWAVTFSDVAVRQYNEGAGTQLAWNTAARRCSSCAVVCKSGAGGRVTQAHLRRRSSEPKPHSARRDSDRQPPHGPQARYRRRRCLATRCRAGCGGRWSRRGGCPARRCTPSRVPATCSARRRARRQRSRQRCSTLSHAEFGMSSQTHMPS